MEDCIFCKIAAGQIPSSTIYEDNKYCVILDLNPASKGHALILPKKHFKDVTELDNAYAADIFPLAARIGTAMKKSLGCTGFNVVQNNGVSAGQTVMHFHVHIIPRYDGGPNMVNWLPGMSSPDETAKIAEQIKAVL